MVGLRKILIGLLLVVSALCAYLALRNPAISEENLTLTPPTTASPLTTFNPITTDDEKKALSLASTTIPASTTSSHTSVLAPSEGVKFSAEIYTYLGTKFDSEAPETSLTFEPNFIATFPSDTSLSLLGTIDRSTNAYENYSVPRIRVRLRQNLDLFSQLKSAIELSSQAMDVDRWAAEGAMIRHMVAARISKTFGEAFTITAKASPFVQTNEYRQTTSGLTKSRYGFSESLTLEYMTGRTTFTGEAILTQRYTSLWKNDYSTSLSVEYALDNTWSLGASHELLTQVVNESTGRYSSLRFFDGRESRYSVYVGIQL